MIIIPDIHGRNFWHEALHFFKDDEDIIFLGDYADPYSFENIDTEDAIHNLQCIISLKREFPEDVTLLLGNHDLSYIFPTMENSRHDLAFHCLYRNLFVKNIALFQMGAIRELNGMQYIFTHAGIHPEWVQLVETMWKRPHLLPSDIISMATNMLYNLDKKLIGPLSVSGILRGGFHSVGSMVWADVDEFQDYVPEPDTYQIFGHSLRTDGKPIIKEHYACLDCRKPFRLTNDGTITSLC